MGPPNYRSSGAPDERVHDVSPYIKKNVTVIDKLFVMCQSFDKLLAYRGKEHLKR